MKAKLQKMAARHALLCVILFTCLALSASEAATEVHFLKQWPDGYVAGNMNCGPACCVMVSAALRGKTPSVVDLKGTLDFLKGDHRQYQGKLEGYWYTDLVSALSGYFGFSGAGWARGKGLEVLKPYLDKGIPIIANVSQVFDPSKPNHRYSLTDHWIVVEGYDRDSVQIVDPGRSLEANGRGQYTINEFNTIFFGTFVYPMTTSAVQQQTIQAGETGSTLWNKQNKPVIYRPEVHGNKVDEEYYMIMTWSPIPGADGYTVYQGDGPEDYDVVRYDKSWDSSETSTTIYDLSFEHTYSLRVAAFRYENSKKSYSGVSEPLLAYWLTGGEGDKVEDLYNVTYIVDP